MKLILAFNFLFFTWLAAFQSQAFFSTEDTAFFDKQYSCRTLRFLEDIHAKYRAFSKTVERGSQTKIELSCASSSKAIDSYLRKQPSQISSFFARQLLDRTPNGNELRVIHSIETFNLQSRPVPKGVDEKAILARIVLCLVDDTMQTESGRKFFSFVSTVCRDFKSKLLKKNFLPNEKKLYGIAANLLVSTGQWYNAFLKSSKTLIPVNLSITDLKELESNFPKHLQYLKMVSNHEGIKLEKVDQNSIWRRIGLRSGDQIHFVSKLRVTHPSDFLNLLYHLYEEKPLSTKILITRNQTLITIQLNSPHSAVAK